LKLQDAQSAYEDRSATASQIVRQISLAGIALVWIFRVAPNSSSPIQVVLDSGLRRGAFFIFLGLFLDLLQYLVGTIIWFAVFRYQEKRGLEEDDEFYPRAELNWPTWLLFWAKVASVMVAYLAYILPFLVRKFG
jgi:hypothetical protein